MTSPTSVIGLAVCALVLLVVLARRVRHRKDEEARARGLHVHVPATARRAPECGYPAPEWPAVRTPVAEILARVAREQRRHAA